MLDEKLKARYWDVVRLTRASGRISPSVVARVEEGWKRFDDDVVEAALRTHIDRYRGYKENYTLGIMRNMQRQKQSEIPIAPRKNRFNDFEQREYDFEELEKELLANQQ